MCNEAARELLYVFPEVLSFRLVFFSLVHVVLIFWLDLLNICGFILLLKLKDLSSDVLNRPSRLLLYFDYFLIRPQSLARFVPLGA